MMYNIDERCVKFRRNRENKQYKENRETENKQRTEKTQQGYLCRIISLVERTQNHITI
jgi:hypothetical protein